MSDDVFCKISGLPICMVCGQPIQADQERGDEHFVPKCLWVKGHRPSQTKKLPAHEACNKGLSADQEYFRDLLVSGEQVQQHPEAQAVWNGPMRRKLNSRPGTFAKNFSTAAIRNVRTPGGIELGPRPTVAIDLTRRNRVLCNVVKGVFYVSQKRSMSQKFVVDIAMPESIERRKLNAVIESMTDWQTFGDTVFGCRYVAIPKDQRDENEPMFEFVVQMIFYQGFTILGSAYDPIFCDSFQ